MIPVPLIMGGLSALGSLFGKKKQEQQNQAQLAQDDYFRRLQIANGDKQFGAQYGLNQAGARIGAAKDLFAGQQTLDERGHASAVQNSLLPIKRQLLDKFSTRIGATPTDWSQVHNTAPKANLNDIQGEYDRLKAMPGYNPMAMPVDPSAQPKRRSNGLLGNILSAGLGGLGGYFAARGGSKAGGGSSDFSHGGF